MGHFNRIFQFFDDGVNELKVPNADIVARNVNEDVNFLSKDKLMGLEALDSHK